MNKQEDFQNRALAKLLTILNAMLKQQAHWNPISA